VEATLAHPQTGNAEGDAELPKKSALVAGHLGRLVKAIFGRQGGLIRGLLEQNFAFDAEQFRGIPPVPVRALAVLVAVRDSGPGVDPANLERIFDAFFSTKADGLGMGLSICRAIIQAHGGRLSATRVAVRGTILRFTLRTAHRELALVGTSRACAIAGTYGERAFVYLKLGKIENAIADYDAALKLDPELAGSLYGRGVAKLRGGDDSGNADLAAAKTVQSDIAEEFARYGVTP
jgi:tetratricopeptide (TPR) repeat protein